MAMNKKRQNILMIKPFIYPLLEQKKLNLEPPAYFILFHLLNNGGCLSPKPESVDSYTHPSLHIKVNYAFPLSPYLTTPCSARQYYIHTYLHTLTPFSTLNSIHSRHVHSTKLLLSLQQHGFNCFTFPRDAGPNTGLLRRTLLVCCHT